MTLIQHPRVTRRGAHRPLSILTLLCLSFTFACEDPPPLVGPEGIPGLNGMNGVDGADGEAGPSGQNGERGEMGTQGIQGMQGGLGETGERGEMGRNGACVGVTPLEITALEGLTETLEEYRTLDVSVVSNVSDERRLSLSFAGSGLDVTFVDRGDQTFTLSAGAAQTGGGIYSVFATDGCTLASASFSLGDIVEVTSSVRVINLMDDAGIIDTWTFTELAESAPSFTEKASVFTGENSMDRAEQIRAGSTTFQVFEFSFGASAPEDYEESDLLATSEAYILERDIEYLLYLTSDPNTEGGVRFDLTPLPTPEETAGLIGISHHAQALGQVDVWDVDTGEALTPSLDPEADSMWLSLPEGVYHLGLDFNQDGIFDERLPAVSISSGTRAHVSTFGVTLPEGACPLDTYFFSIASLDIEDEGLTRASPSQYAFSIDQLTPCLPYMVPYEPDSEMDSSSNAYLEIHAPEDTTSMRVTLDVSVERNFDFFVAHDEQGVEVTRTTGNGQVDVVVDVVGDMVALGVISDSRSQSAGYTIKSIELNRAP